MTELQIARQVLDALGIKYREMRHFTNGQIGWHTYLSTNTDYLRLIEFNHKGELIDQVVINK